MNRKVKIVLITIAVLALFRLMLPLAIRMHVNHILNSIDGYSGTTAGVRVHLLQARYDIDSLRIFTLSGKNTIPFVTIPRVSIALDIESLYRGKTVSTIKLLQPSFTFVTHRFFGAASPAAFIEFTLIRKISPFSINHISIRDGRVSISDMPHSSLLFQIDRLQLEAQNLSQIRKYPGILPARVLLQARSTGNGLLSMSMRLDSRKPFPEMDMDLKFENINLVALRDFFKVYGGLDLITGSLNVYSEMNAMEGKLNGYVTPKFSNLNFRKGLSEEGALNEYQEISLSGSREHEVNASVARSQELWPSLWNIFLNTCVSEFQKNTSPMISVASAGRSKNKFHK